jgi:hypothetical protein
MYGILEFDLPAELVQAVANTLQKQRIYHSTAKALNAWFDSPLADVPDDILLRISKDIAPGVMSTRCPFLQLCASKRMNTTFALM